MKKSIYLFLFCLILVSEGIAQSTSTFTYTGKPRFQILTKRNGNQLGVIKVELFPNIAPKHTRNFDSLVSTLFYDTTAFHRVIPGFVIQGGCPNSRSGPISTWGQGQVGQPTVMAEFTAAKHLRGRLSAARKTNINSATSQFFICHANTPSLDGNYSVYGRVTEGLNYVDTIALAPRDANDNPLVKIEMFVTYIGSNDSVPVPPVLNAPKPDSLEVDTLVNTSLKWFHVPDGIIYNIQVSADSTFATTLYNANTGNLNYIVPAGLPGGTDFFWRVRTNNGGHFSPWSPIRRFKTQMPFSDVGISEANNTKELGSVYPNPSNGVFIFSGLSQGTLVEIYDINGKKVYETKAKESHLKINIEGTNKGIYTYKLTSNGSVKSGKLVIK